MESEKAERLRTLQMVDLGSARRDYITSSDGRRSRKPRLEDIEAARLSNQPGTEAQHLAQKNQQQLTEWKNAFKKIGEEDLEDLDDLLSGQSHRLQLNAVLRAGGAQGNTRFTETLPELSTRSSIPRGRGGGIIGTRGRGDAKQVNVKFPLNTSNHASASKPGYHIPQFSDTRKPSLDPALDVNNDRYVKPHYQSGRTRDNSKRNPVPAVVKTRRPMGDFSRLLSPPDSFLAEARSIIHPRTQDVTPAATGKVSDLDSDTSRLLLQGPQGNNAILEEDVDRSTPQSIANPSTPLHPQKKTAIVPTPTTGSNGSPMAQPNTVPVTLSPKPADIASTIDEAGGSTPKSTNDERSVPKVVNKGEHNNTTDQSGELLLDLSSTPPTKSSLANNGDLIMSPSLVDLKGLDFMQSSTDTVRNTSHQFFHKRLESEELPMDLESDGRDPAPHDKYQHDIELLCKLMASTYLSGKHRESLEECKAELEAKLHRAQQTPTLTPTSPGPSSNSITKGDSGLSDSEISDILRPLRRLNVEAEPFVPVNVPLTLTQVRTRSVSFAALTDHIFGDHLLPGQREKQRLIQLKDPHIFGDHLLPGRRQVTESHSSGIRFSIPVQRSTLPKARITQFQSSDNSASPSPRPLSDSTQTVMRTAPANKTFQRHDSPVRPLQLSIHAPKENQAPEPGGQALDGLQTSIYAVPDKASFSVEMRISGRKCPPH